MLRIMSVNQTDPNASLSYAESVALGRKLYLTEVITAFDEMNVFKNLTMLKEITQGKSVGFPITWKTDARYHKPGVPLTGSSVIGANEIIVNVDDVLLSDIMIPKIDEVMQHFETRSEYSRQQAAALSRTFDSNIARIAIKTARGTGIPTISGKPVGGTITSATAATDSDALIKLILGAVQKMAENDVPIDIPGEISTVLRPAQYFLLLQNDKIISKDYGQGNGLVTGKVEMIANTVLKMSNHIPSTNIASATDGEHNDYTGDFSKTLGVTLHRSAVGTVQLLGMTTEEDYLIKDQATMLVAKQAVGHGGLRPEAAVELASV